MKQKREIGITHGYGGRRPALHIYSSSIDGAHRTRAPARRSALGSWLQPRRWAKGRALGGHQEARRDALVAALELVDVRDIIPRMAVERLFEPLLVQIVADETNRAAEDEEAVQAPVRDEIISLWRDGARGEMARASGAMAHAPLPA